MSELKLRPYQEEALRIMADNKHPLEFDDMGLGKSVITLKHLERNTEPWDKVLIICPVNALYVWKQEIEKWTNCKSVLYHGTPKQRSDILGHFVSSKNDATYMLTTSGLFTELFDLEWRHIIGDEIHRWGLLNHKTKAFKNIQRFQKQVDQVILLTGTPIRQGCIDLYAPLHLANPTYHSSYWQYVNRWCDVTQTSFGKRIERRPKDLQAFRNMWGNHIVRRLAEEVHTDLPGKQRNVIPIQMTTKQAKAHKEVMEELMHLDKDSDSLVVAQNKMVAQLKARQLLVTPRLLGIDEDGAGLDYLRAVVPDYIIADKPVVIFTPFRDAIPIIADVLCDACDNAKEPVRVYNLHGQMTPAQFGDSWMGFQNTEESGKKKVLICTIKSGAAFHATEASKCFFLGAEFDFNHNEQCENRLYRIGQTHFVNCDYLLYEGDTVDQDVRERLNDKKRAAMWSIGSEMQYAKLLEATKGDKS